jgi:hypothetical protein
MRFSEGFLPDECCLLDYAFKQRPARGAFLQNFRTERYTGAALVSNWRRKLARDSAAAASCAVPHRVK